jgi:hypothetical protein
MNFLKRLLNWNGFASGEGGFIAAALTAAPYILNALGGVFGKKKKYLDPEMMKQKYGPAAIANETQQLANFILNSPYGQQLLSQAATSGQDLQTEMASRAAAAGLSPDTGGESGASTFAAAAAPQAQANLERATKAGIWQNALPVAAQSVANRAALEQGNIAEQNQDPSTFQKIAAAAGQMTDLGDILKGKKKPKTTLAGGTVGVNTLTPRTPGEQETPRT